MKYDHCLAESDGWHRLNDVKKSSKQPTRVLSVENACFEWRRIPDLNWRKRERGRFGNGYTHLPDSWSQFSHDNGKLNDHFLHVSINDKNLIAFTESEEKGQLDIQTKMKPGRYLQRYQPELSMERQRHLCAEFSSFFDDQSLKITQDPHEIIEVYKNGPRSCMSNEFQKLKAFTGYDNPACVYGNCDLGVAYIGNRSKPEARCIVWPEKKIFGRQYGYGEKLVPLLLKAGYVNSYKEFSGANIRLIPADDTGRYIVMPYLDVAPYGFVSPCGKFVTLSHGAPDKKLMQLNETMGMVFLLDEQKRCAVSNIPIKDNETIEIGSGDSKQVAIKAEAVKAGYVFTVDGIWTQSYMYVIGADNIKYPYSSHYIDENRSMFLRDARSYTWYAADHPNIVTVYDSIRHVGLKDQVFSLFSPAQIKKFVIFRGNYYRSLSLLQSMHPRETHPCPDYVRAELRRNRPVRKAKAELAA